MGTTDLTDAELEAARGHGASSGTATPPPIRDAIVRMVAEIRRRRAADLTGDDLTVLRQLRPLLISPTSRSPIKRAAVALIDKLLARRGG
jgi:hypothetical protein